MSEITTDSLVIGGRKRGRPRVEAGSETTDRITLHIGPSLHEKACQAASLRGVPVREFIREAIRLGILVTTKSSSR